MSSKSFVKVLRKIIREEVRSAVKEIITEQNINHDKVMSHGMNLHTMTEQPKPQSKSKSKKSFSSNSMLNDILDETAGTADFASMQQGPLVMQQDSWPDMGSMRTSNTVQGPLATHDTTGRPVNMQNENVAKTVENMTKDYRGLMKAIDKKKGK